MYNIENTEKETLIMRECPFCGIGSIVKVNCAHYTRWLYGELMQNAMPELSAAQREILKTGICPVCWDKMFDVG